MTGEDMTIGPNTLFRGTLVVGAIVFAFGAGVWATNIQGTLTALASDVTKELRALRSELESQTAGRVTEARLKAWIRMMRVQNPTLQIPDLE